MVKTATTADIEAALAAKRITQANTALIFDEPFFGTLVLRLTAVCDPTCDTAWTDGTRVGYNPTFINKHTFPETLGVICHEVLHNVMGHPWRRGDRQPYRWNVACDFVINPILKQSGFVLPGQPMTLAQFLAGAQGHLDDKQFYDLSSEEVYAKLPADIGKGQGLDFGPGAVREAKGEEQDKVEQRAEWDIAVAQAARVAQQQGKLPAALETVVKELLRPKVDYKALTLQFVQSLAKGDYAWSRPNRKYVPQGLYLPALYSEELGPMGVGIDTSGSVAHVLDQFFTDMKKGIIEVCRPERTHVFYCDAAVGVVETFEPDDEVTCPTVAQGGTDFRPVFERIAKDNLDLACLIYLTDLEGDFPDKAPDYPVLWVTINDHIAPFGDTVRMEL